MKLRIVTAAALVVGALVVTACQSDGDRLENAADSTGEAIDDAGDAISDTVDDVTDSAAWQRIEGNWKQFTGSAKERWAELTDDEIGEIDGKKDQLVGTVQERYGIAKGEAEAQVDEWANSQ